MANTLTFTPSRSTRGTQTARLLEAKFGDGYSQRTLDGINPALTTWSLVYTNIQWSNVDPTKATLTSVDAFFRANVGLKFIWVPPAPYNDITRYFVCAKWDWIYDSGQVVSGLTAELVEVPGV